MPSERVVLLERLERLLTGKAQVDWDLMRRQSLANGRQYYCTAAWIDDATGARVTVQTQRHEEFTGALAELVATLEGHV